MSDASVPAYENAAASELPAKNWTPEEFPFEDKLQQLALVRTIPWRNRKGVLEREEV